MSTPVLEHGPPRGLVGAFVLLWWTLGIGLLISSVQTAAHALASAHPNPHLVLLGAVETVSASLFLIPRTARVGASGLLLTLIVGCAAHSLQHEVRWDLAVYAAAVLFVAVHGASLKQGGAAPRPPETPSRSPK